MCDNEVNIVGVRFSTEVEETKIRFLIFCILWVRSLFRLKKEFNLSRNQSNPNYQPHSLVSTDFHFSFNWMEINKAL